MKEVEMCEMGEMQDMDKMGEMGGVIVRMVEDESRQCLLHTGLQVPDQSSG